MIKSILMLIKKIRVFYLRTFKIKIGNKYKHNKEDKVVEVHKLDDDQVSFYIEGQATYEGARNKKCRHSYITHIFTFAKNYI